MPERHICPEPGCGRLTAGGPCTSHAAQRRRRDNKRRNSRTNLRQIYTSRAWQRTRATVLRRDSYRCTGPGPHDTTLTAAHRKPITWLQAHGYDPLDPNVCVTLCRRCHGRIDGGRARTRAGSSGAGAKLPAHLDGGYPNPWSPHA